MWYSPIKKYDSTWKQAFKGLTPLQHDLLLNLAVQENPNDILDPHALRVLTQLKHMKVKAIAFTAALSGKVNGSSMPGHVYKELKALGISFEDSFPNIKDVKFKDLPRYHAAYSEYYKGILFANGEGAGLSKGDLLVHFLRHINYTPKVVIIADDKRTNIDGLETALKKAYPDIKLEGLEYLYGYTLPVSKFEEIEFQKFLQNLRKKALAAS